MSQQNSNVDVESFSEEAANLAGMLFQQNNPTEGMPVLKSIDNARNQEYFTIPRVTNDQEDFGCSFEFDEEIKNALADIEESDELGPAVGPFLAEAYNRTISRPLSKDNAEKLKLGLKIPENCSNFRVPKMNPEMWNNMPQEARIVDLKHQQLQQTLSQGLTVLVKMCDELSQAAAQMPKDVLTKVLKIGLDGANIMGTQMQELNQKRKSEMRPYLNPDIVDICSAKTPVSEFLFGPNLAETLKATKAASSVMKTTITSRRFRPYATQQPGSLNGFRPSTPHRGWWNEYQQQHPRQQAPRMFQSPRFPNPTIYKTSNARFNPK
ncbi:hypothetical protein Ocin01_14965 [Orchesella cincta]|uniref:Uncharacterized protein n=1 Tax=Orchesella cincta TaxID=48709 RepID=A0A1D2MFF6_ORCCI|nr:hypothetical protein Ocin01_14965 [Orchesella cincta]